MNELTKKFYWLIVTAVFSLFIFLCTATFKQLGNIPLPDPTKIKSEEWLHPLGMIVLAMNDREKDLKEYKSQVDSIFKKDSLDFSTYLAKSLVYDFEIRRHIAILEVKISETSAYSNNTNDFIAFFYNEFLIDKRSVTL